MLRLKAQSEVNTRVVAPVLDDLEMLSVLALAWKPECVLAADVSSALARLATKRLQSISDTLPKCDLGGEMLASSALVIQRSSQTAAADTSFARAESLLSSHRTPYIRTDGDVHVLVNRHMAADGSAFEVLGEALDLIDQAIEQWSRLDMSKNASAVKACIEKLMGHLLIVENSLALDLELLLGEACMPDLVLDAASNATRDWDAEQAASVFESALDVFRGASLQEEEHMSKFMKKRLLPWLKKLPHDILSQEELKTIVEGDIEPLLGSEAARTQTFGVYRLMSDVLSSPDMSAASFYAELQACASAADMANTRLSKAVMLQHEVVQLKGAAPIQFRGAGSFYENTTDVEDGEAPALAEHPGNAQLLLNATQTLQCIVELERAVGDSLYLMFEDIAKYTCLSGLKVPSSVLLQGPEGVAPTADMLEACMVCTTHYAEPIDRLIQSRDDRLWPGVTLVEVACEILDMFDTLGGRSVGVSPLLTLTTQTTVTRMSDHSALKHVLHLFEAAGKIGRLLAWLKRKLFPAADSAKIAEIVTSSKDHADIEQALHMLQACISNAATLTAGEAPTGGSSVEIMPWKIPVDKLAQWVSSAQSVYHRLCADVMTVLVGNLLQSALALGKLVPSYDHYFNPTLKLDSAAKFLLRWPSKKALGAGCCALETDMANASESFTTFGTSCTLTTDPRFAEQMAEVEATYVKSKSALMVIAGLNCCVNVAKEKRTAVRDGIVQQHKFLPQSLLRHLVRLQ